MEGALVSLKAAVEACKASPAKRQVLMRTVFHSVNNFIHHMVHRGKEDIMGAQEEAVDSLLYFITHEPMPRVVASATANALATIFSVGDSRKSREVLDTMLTALKTKKATVEQKWYVEGTMVSILVVITRRLSVFVPSCLPLSHPSFPLILFLQLYSFGHWRVPPCARAGTWHYSPWSCVKGSKTPPCKRRKRLPEWLSPTNRCQPSYYLT